LRAFDLGRIDSQSLAALRLRAKAALADEFGDAVLPVVKDPRMCRLMGFWAPVFEEAQWAVRAVLPLRSPLEVAQSLNRRDGLNVAWACLVWLRHVLDAEAETRAMPRAVLDWSYFLGRKREALTRAAEQLGLTWPNGDESAFADVEELVSPSMRHHTATEVDLRAHPAISDLMVETRNSLLKLVDDPKNVPVMSRIDDLRARFEAAAAVFGEATQGLEEDLQNARLRAAERDALAAQRQAERDVLAAQLASEREALSAQLASERDGAERLAASRDALAAALAEEQRVVAQRSAARDELAVHLSAARSEVDIASRRLLTANERIDRAEETIAYIAGRYADKRNPSKEKLFRSWRTLKASPVSEPGVEAIRNSVFFDEPFYLEMNPDVREAGQDAALHYLLHGAAEGRDPGPFFSTTGYLTRYPEIAAANINPLLHYETQGRREERRASSKRPLATESPTRRASARKS
jgi:hypothetical protein